MITRESIELRLAVLAELRKAASERYDAAQEPASAEKRALSVDERQAVAAIRAEVDSIDAETKERRADLAKLAEAEKAAAAEAPEGRADTDTAEERQASAAAARQRGGATVTRERRTYEKWDPHTSYFRDFLAVNGYAGIVSAGEARARLDRHRQELAHDLPKLEGRIARRLGGYVDHISDPDERRAAEILYQGEYEARALTRVDGSGGDFVPPIYIMDEWVDLARAGRVTANLCNSMPLPSGTDSINLPRLATGVTTAIQTADNASVSATDITAATVTASVRTVAGQQDIALQLLDQSPLNFDQIIFQDLAKAYATNVDTQVLAGTNASGQVLGMTASGAFTSFAYTDASPTVPEFYSRFAGAASTYVTGRFDMPTHILMHPRRWYWMQAAVDTTNRPLVVVQNEGPFNSVGTSTPGATAQGFAGVTAFGPVFLDPSITITTGAGTTEDAATPTLPAEMYLGEGSVRTRARPDVGSGTLTVRLQLFNYLAFMPNRRAALNTVVIAGTGLVTPTF